MSSTSKKPVDPYKKLSVTQLSTAIQKALEKEAAGLAGPFEEVNKDLANPQSEKHAKFKTFLRGLFHQLDIDKQLVKQYDLVSPATMHIYVQSMTHASVDRFHNCDVFVKLGSESVQKSLEDYFLKKFPELMIDSKANAIMSEAPKQILNNAKYYEQLKTEIERGVYLDIPTFFNYKKVKYEIGKAPDIYIREIIFDEEMYRKAFWSLVGAIEYVINYYIAPADRFTNFGSGVVDKIIRKSMIRIPITISLSQTVKPTKKLTTLANIYGIRMSLSKKKDDKNITTHIISTVVFPDGYEKQFISKNIESDEVKGKEDVANKVLGFLEEEYNIEYRDYDTTAHSTGNIRKMDAQLLRDLINDIISIINVRGKFRVTFKELIDNNALELIQRAFRHAETEKYFNYELFEKVGDKTFNKVVTTYAVRKHPEIFGDVIASKKLDEVSKRFHSMYIAPYLLDKLNILKYLEEYNGDVMQGIEENKLKTDLFESFVFLIERLVNDKFGVPFGYDVVYRIVESLLEELPEGMRITTSLDENLPKEQQIKEIFEKSDAIFQVDKNSGNIKVTFKNPTESTKFLWEAGAKVSFDDKNRPFMYFITYDKAATWARNVLKLCWREGVVEKC